MDEDDARRRRAAAVGAAALGDDEDHSESFSSAQATLLHLIREEVSVAPAINPDAGPDAGPESHLVLCEGTLSYLLDATSRAAGAVEAVASAKLVEESAEANATAARCVLEECLGMARPERGSADVQTPATSCPPRAPWAFPGFARPVTAMPPPTGAGQTSSVGPAAAPGQPNPVRAGGRPPAFPRAAVAGTAWLHRAARQRLFARPLVCDQVAKLGGVTIVLAATQGGTRRLPRWALWGVRNLCAGTTSEARSSGWPQAARLQQLAAMGLNVELAGRSKFAWEARDGGGWRRRQPGPSPARAFTGAAGSSRWLAAGPRGRETPAGRAAVAALMAGLDVVRASERRRRV